MKTAQVADRLLTAKEVAKLLGVHISTVWRLTRRVENPLPAVRFGERITRCRISWVAIRAKPPLSVMRHLKRNRLSFFKEFGKDRISHARYSESSIGLRRGDGRARAARGVLFAASEFADGG